MQASAVDLGTEPESDVPRSKVCQIDILYIYFFFIIIFYFIIIICVRLYEELVSGLTFRTRAVPDESDDGDVPSVW